MIFNLRKIELKDSSLLFGWVNDSSTRENSFNSKTIKPEEHQIYIQNMLGSQTKNQYILEIDNVPIGTIKDNILEDCIEISYALSPLARGKKLSSILMNLYLVNKTGKFLCKIKTNNIPSIKMVERCGFILDKVIDKVGYYILER